MPTYPVKHKETGEEKELYMSMKEYDQWRVDNPDWDKDWSKQGRMTVRFRQDFLRGIHGHPDHKDYGQPPSVTVTDAFADENGHKDETYTERIGYCGGTPD